MRLATWNVNSVRARTDRIVDWLQRTGTDVLAMQETKCKDEQFPYERFEELGYRVAHVGLSQWNGVAIASRIGLDDVQIGFEDQPGFTKDPDADPAQEARAIGATCGGVRVWSLYVPNGRELADPHYVYKLEWLAKLRADAQAWLAADPQKQIALVGDWNIAPTDEDVWDPAFFDGKTHTSEPEREAFRAFLDSGFTDVVRPHAPGPGVTDGVTGVANAWRANSPILVIGGQGPFNNLRRGSLQEMDHVGVMRPITKFADTVYQTHRIGEYAELAIRHAVSGIPGPAFLEIPMDVFMGSVEWEQAQIPPIRTQPPRVAPAWNRPRPERAECARPLP